MVKSAARKSAKKTRIDKLFWNLDELYSSKDDPRIEKDFKALNRHCAAFAKKYRGQVRSMTVDELLSAMKDRERIEKIAFRLFIFAQLEFSTKSNDPAWGAFMQSVQERYTQAAVNLEFFTVEWNRLPESKASKLAADPRLARFRHWLEHARLYRKHTLSEKEEILTSKLSQVGGSAWTRYYGSVLSDIEYIFRGKKITESELTALAQSPDRNKRKEASATRSKALLANEKPLTYAFNMILGSKKISDEVRSYDHWVQSRNLSNEIPDPVVDALVEAMTSRVDIMQRYMKMKRKLLGVPKLMSFDVWAPLPGTKETRADYADARKLVNKVFAETRPSFGKIAREMFRAKHVDVPPRQGKRGGAFCMPNMEGLPYVLMNWTGKQRDVSTLAHEFGHAVHMELSRKRGPLGRCESLVMAEVASVFMETILFNRMLKGSRNSRERLGLLKQIIEDGFMTTFRQMQFNRFEDRVHNLRREKGELTREEISKVFGEVEKDFFGSSMKAHKGSENSWMYITHFVNVPGYVYAYAASYLVVLALYRRYEEVGPDFLVKYEQMLAAGGSKSPAQLLGELGVDWTDPAFWHGGIDVLAEYIDQFETTARELKLL